MNVRMIAALALGAAVAGTALANPVWYFDDTGATGWGQSYAPPDYWEYMNPATLGPGTVQDLDVANPYWASTQQMTESFFDVTFEVHLWMANNYEFQSNPVGVELGYGQYGGAPFTPLSPVSIRNVTNYSGDSVDEYIYTFSGVTLDLNAESMIVKISYSGQPGDAHLYWDSVEHPSGLYMIPAPGTLALLGLAGLARRRRRELH